MNNEINSVDPNHIYVFKSGEYGSYLNYWYQDPAGNYYLYSNAPLESPDHDVVGGQPIMDPNQPFMHDSPQFFTAEGFKRNTAAPEGVKTLPNPSYNPAALSTSWFEYYLADSGDLRYIYLDKDVKESLDLYVQHQIRVVDAGLTKLRKYAAMLFQKQAERDKAIGCILMLTDQAWFTVTELSNARVADIDFIDETVYLLGRKVRVDVPIFDYLTSLAAGRALFAPLFSQNTLHGSDMPFGERTISAIYAYLRVSPVFLQYWHATHLFSKIVNKLSVLQADPTQVEWLSYNELANTLNTSNDIKYLVDSQVSETLLRNYIQNAQMQQEQSEMVKSFNIAQSDSYGVAQVLSDLVERRGDELEFSQWLHRQPLHSEYEGDTSEDDEELISSAQEAKEMEDAESLLAQENMDKDGDGIDDNFVDEDGSTPNDEPQGDGI